MALLVTAFAVYRIMLPKAFIVVGKKGMITEKLKVVRLSRSLSVIDNGKTIQASPGHVFVQIDYSTSMPADEIDVYDFQLVQGKAERIGNEQNIGDNLGDNYFFWYPTNIEGKEITDYDENGT